jgi:rhamnulose-1-phosphate aldolase
MTTSLLHDLLEQIGQAGRRLAEIEASEGAAGNISVCLRQPFALDNDFPESSPFSLPQPAPGLAGAMLIVSGSGRRLREILDDPAAHLACVQVNADGVSAQLRTAPRRRFARISSEFNSHLAVHHDHMRASGVDFHTVIHAQPLRLTYLSHIPRYADFHYLNTHLLRWQPESIVNLPEGIGFMPFRVPGSSDMMAGNLELLRRHKVVVWAKHGVMARSSHSVKHAADLVEYAETAAKYEYLNLCAGEIGEGLSHAEIRAICAAFNVRQDIF